MKEVAFNDLPVDALDHFIRYEVVEYAWRTAGNRMVLKPVSYKETLGVKNCSFKST